MNNLNIKLGIGSSIIIIVGCLLKIFHLQGAEEVLTLGFLFFSLIFMPFIIFSQLKEKKIIHAIAGFFLSTLILGVLFKIMHWPFANFLISWSVTISLFGVTPIYIISNYYTKINENFSKEDRMKSILIGVFILAILSLKYAMMDLSKIPSPYSIP
ncbi:MAG: hypothetical protein HN336_00705 [Lentimicrobiaceae bacterium]|jgi:hypothetical protein|nr:hypothetical protein [Lentimicrobiaceae bacterium]MCP4909760.1 hypothetical protein [Bacteroidota bacterium]MBT3453727.1 hypothetical protein [Lentimicrobiaceae bacterium]MBT3819548.1 hypothetical protein [Lentimicrobiaceae bacterium]MBT4061689.1 hypothetical protein [Lentimicrobiaceae bacterium]